MDATTSEPRFEWPGQTISVSLPQYEGPLRCEALVMPTDGEVRRAVLCRDPRAEIRHSEVFIGLDYGDQSPVFVQPGQVDGADLIFLRQFIQVLQEARKVPGV